MRPFDPNRQYALMIWRKDSIGVVGQDAGSTEAEARLCLAHYLEARRQDGFLCRLLPDRNCYGAFKPCGTVERDIYLEVYLICRDRVMN